MKWDMKRDEMKDFVEKWDIYHQHLYRRNKTQRGEEKNVHENWHRSVSWTAQQQQVSRKQWNFKRYIFFVFFLNVILLLLHASAETQSRMEKKDLFVAWLVDTPPKGKSYGTRNCNWISSAVFTVWLLIEVFSTLVSWAKAEESNQVDRFAKCFTLLT